MLSMQERIDAKNKALHEARAIHERAEKEKREMTAEERDQFQTLVSECSRSKKEIDTIEEFKGHVRAAEDDADRRTIRPQTRKPAVLLGDLRNHVGNSFQGYASRDPRFVATMEAEARSLSVDTAMEGGYLIPPVQWLDEIIKTVDDSVFILNRARVIDVKLGQKLEVPKRTARMTGLTWGGEKLAPPKDAGLAYGSLTLEPKDAALEILVSRSLVDMGGSLAENEIRTEMVYASGIGLETQFLNGPGGVKPVGVFSANADFIDTTRDFTGANGQTTLHPDTFKRAKYNIKVNYWPGLTWTMHRSIMEQVAILKDGMGQYLLKEGLAEGDPDRIDGIRVDLSEFAPSALTAGSYVALLCDWKQYWVVRRRELKIEMLRELYAESSQYAFIGRLAYWAAPTKKEAFLRIAMAP